MQLATSSSPIIRSGAEASGDMEVVVVVPAGAGEESSVVVVVVLLLLLLVDDSLDAAEVVDAAGDGDGALLLEPVLLLRRLEQRHEQRVLQVTHGDHEPLLLLAAGWTHHPHRHAPLGRHPAAHRRRGVLLLQKVHAHLPIDRSMIFSGKVRTATRSRRPSQRRWGRGGAAARRLQLHDDRGARETASSSMVCIGVGKGGGGGRLFVPGRHVQVFLLRS
jgi:hypothetical protein